MRRKIKETRIGTEKGFSIYCAGQLGDEAFAETDLWDYRLRRSAMGVKNKPFK